MTLTNAFNEPTPQEVWDFTEAACWEDNAAITAFLKKYPDAIDIKDGNGTTALMCAAVYGKISTAILLLESGADVNVESDGTTALTCAQKNNEDAISMLLQERIKKLRQEQELATEIANFSAALTRDIPATSPLIRKGMKP